MSFNCTVCRVIKPEKLARAISDQGKQQFSTPCRIFLMAVAGSSCTIPVAKTPDPAHRDKMNGAKEHDWVEENAKSAQQPPVNVLGGQVSKMTIDTFQIFP